MRLESIFLAHLLQDFSHHILRFLLCANQSVCVSHVRLALEVTWEDQQRGLNGSLSDGGTQSHPSLTDTGWLAWMWISDSLEVVFHLEIAINLFENTQ